MPEYVKAQTTTLLRWSERWFKTDMVYLVSGGFWLTVAKIAGMFSSLVLAILFANFVSPYVYGSYKYIMSIVGFLAVSTLPGASIAFLRTASRGNEGFFYRTFRSKMLWGLLGAAGAATLGAYYLYMGNMEFAVSYLVIALCIPFMDPFGFYDTILQARRLFKLSTWFSLATLGTTTAITSTIIVLSPSLVALVAASMLGATLVRGLVFLFATRRFRPNTTANEDIDTEGKHLTVLRLITIGSGALSSVLIFQLLGPVALAVFTFAIAPIEQIRGWLGIIEPVIFPKISHEDWRTESPWHFFAKVSSALGMLAVAVFVYILLAPYLFRLIFPQYLDAVAYSQVLGVTLLLSAMTLLLAIILRAKGEVAKMYIANISSAIVYMILVAPATYLWGIWGLVGAMFASKIIDFSVLSYLVFANIPFKENPQRSSTEEYGSRENQ